MTDRDAMEFDVVVVGGGPAGLATAIHIRQLCEREGLDLSVCLVEKGSEIGAHILSGAVIEPRALAELFPDWQERGAPLHTPVSGDEVHFLLNGEKSVAVPQAFIPKALHNEGNYVASLANFCRWLGEQAEALGVEVLAGFAAAEVLYDDAGRVLGVATGERGRNKAGEESANYEPGYELRARYTVFAEGCRGHLGKQLIARFGLDEGRTPQHYAIGLKELWEIPAEKHRPGHVFHALGWPLGMGGTSGGSFLYHMEDNQVSVGLIVDLNYSNPWLNPYEEFQRLKLHPRIRGVLEGGRRLSYGARALVKGGLQALPKTVFPGGMLVGDNAGYLNFLKLKGSHAAMKSGMLAAEAVVEAFRTQPEALPDLLEAYPRKFESSWLYEELNASRNSAPAMHRFGTLFGSAFTFLDQTLFRGKLPFTLRDDRPDHATLLPAADCPQPDYPKPDGVLTFDRMSSVFVSNTNHEEDQPSHLKMLDPVVPIRDNLARYAEPAQRYCPAGVYEVVMLQGEPSFRINAQNCVHCKTCDIKDPAQNLIWTAPEGGGGPNYPNM